MKRSLVWILGGMVMLTACGELQGILHVTSALNFLNNKKANLSIAPGDFSASVGFDKDKNEIKIKIEKAVNGQDQEIDVFAPRGQPIPTTSGSFVVKSADSGQPFDLAGNVDTQVTDSPEMNENQSCTYQVEEYECRDVVVNDPNGKSHVERQCGDVWETRYGYQMVTYHTETTTVTGQTQFLDPQSQQALASFSGDNSNTQTINDYQGPCN